MKPVNCRDISFFVFQIFYSILFVIQKKLKRKEMGWNNIRVEDNLEERDTSRKHII